MDKLSLQKKFLFLLGKSFPALTLPLVFLFVLGCTALTPSSEPVEASFKPAPTAQDCYILAWGPEDYKELKKAYQKNQIYYKISYETFLTATMKTEEGFSYLRLYKAAEAQAAFEKALQTYPHFARPQIGLAVIEFKIHHHLPRAKQIMEKALLPPFEASPEVRAFGHTYLAIIENLSAAAREKNKSKVNREEAKQDTPDPALTHLQEAAHLNPNSLIPYIYWGEILWNRGRYPEALEVYRQAVKRVPSPEDPQYEDWGWLSLRLCQVLYKAGQFREAKEKLKTLAQTVNTRKRTLFWSSSSVAKPPRLWQAMAQEMYKNMELKPEAREEILLSLSHQPQLDSFCVPAATASILEYYGESCSQEEVAEGANTSVNFDTEAAGKVGTMRQELINYVRRRGFLAYNFCGTVALTKEMVKKGFPVIVSLRYPSGAAHVMVIVGYDDRLGAFVVNDPATVREDYYPYGYFSMLWGAAFNNSLLIVPKNKAQEVEDFRQSMIYCSSKDTVNEGDYYQSEGNPSRAREAYFSALKEDARNLEALYKLALADIRDKDYSAAKGRLEKAREVVEQEGRCWEITWDDCEVNPLRSQLDLAMAFVQERLGNKAEGDKLYQNAFTQNPYNMEAWYQRALAGDNEAFAVLMEYQPQKTQNHLLWGKTLVQQGKNDEAAKEFRKAIRQNPQLAEAYYQLGLLAESDHDFEAAQICFTCTEKYAKNKALQEAAKKKRRGAKPEE